MKYLKPYNKLFENNQSIHDICSKYGIENYTINDDGSIDVNGDVNLSSRNLTKLPLKFRNVSGDFNCHDNQLRSLEGAPQSVGGHFSCYDNKLTSLEGAPQSVGGGFYCINNPVFNIWKLFQDFDKIELFNDYDTLREIDGKPHVVLDRLNSFLMDIGKDPVEKVNGWINI